MTTDEFIKKQNERLAQIEKVNKPLELAVRSIMSIQSKRIFLDGKNADEAIIGEYSKKPIYVSTNQNKGLPKFPLKGKSGSSDFKNGNKHKSGYFNNYLSFKESIGRNKRIKSVDLFLTGQLLRNWSNSEVLSKAEATKVSQHHYVVKLSEDNAKKVDRYGNVFGLSIREKAKFLSVIQFELAKVFKK